MLDVYAHRHAGGPRACSGLNEMKIKYAHIEPLWLSWSSPLFHPNFRGVPVAPDRPCWGQRGHGP